MLPALPKIRSYLDELGEQRASGLLLIAVTAAALIWANSPFRESYAAVQHFEVRLGAGPWELAKSLHHWVNDGLMAVFFLLIGLEIKHEFTEGALSHPKRAALTLAAALGGMVVPVALYLLLNSDPVDRRGWGVPMATDIAFAVALLALLGDRVPASVKAFLAAMAVVDDIGAITVIAVFYSRTVDFPFLGVSIALLAALIAYGRRGGQRVIVYTAVGLVSWYCMLRSGVHATLSGVLMGFAVAASSPVDKDQLREQVDDLSQELEEDESGTDEPAVKLRQVAARAQSPKHRVENAIRHWVLFAVMPLFALFNAGIELGSQLPLWSPVFIGVFAGLTLGKPAGVFIFAWLVLRIGWGKLPRGMDIRNIVGVGILAGIGFTMALFIATLAFPGGHALAAAKAAILSASIFSGAAGLWFMSRINRKTTGT